MDEKKYVIEVSHVNKNYLNEKLNSSCGLSQ